MIVVVRLIKNICKLYIKMDYIQLYIETSPLICRVKLYKSYVKLKSYVKVNFKEINNNNNNNGLVSI